MEISKQDYEAAKVKALISKTDPPRLTEAGETVYEYGMNKALLQLELSPDQQSAVVKQHFPEKGRGDRLDKAMEYYEASGLFGDEELSE